MAVCVISSTPQVLSNRAGILLQGGHSLSLAQIPLNYQLIIFSSFQRSAVFSLGGLSLSLAQMLLNSQFIYLQFFGTE